MASKVTTLFEDSAKTNALYPRTKVSAVSDGSGNGLDALLSNINANKQDTLVSGTNIKTVGGNSLLGSGNIPTFHGLDSTNIIITQNWGASKSYTWTATADGWAVFSVGNNTGGLSLDDVKVTSLGNYATSQVIPVKAGQVVKVDNSDSRVTTNNLTVYALL